MTPAALTTAKRTLRSSIKKSLSSISPESLRTQSDACTQAFLALPEYSMARSLSIFLSMPSKEVDTSAIVENSLDTDKTVYVPYIHRHPLTQPLPASTSSGSPPTSIMDMLTLSSKTDFHSLQPDNWGIPTIPPETTAGRANVLDGSVDIVAMPGVAFDRSFNRLGHGKGFYDFFLTRYKLAKGRMPLLVALALKEQLLDADIVPVDESDWKVDIIITGDGQCLRRSQQQRV